MRLSKQKRDREETFSIQTSVSFPFDILRKQVESNRYTSANAVARLDNLEFLSDVVPRTTTYAKFQDRKKRQAEAEQKALIEGPREHRSPIQSFSNLSGGPAPHSNGSVYTNGSQHSALHSFAGPSVSGSRSAPINLLDDGDAMDVEHPRGASQGRSTSSQQQVPTTMELLERARAAQARAELGLSHSPSLPPPTPDQHLQHPNHAPYPSSSLPPGSNASANPTS